MRARFFNRQIVGTFSLGVLAGLIVTLPEGINRDNAIPPMARMLLVLFSFTNIFVRRPWLNHGGGPAEHCTSACTGLLIGFMLGSVNPTHTSNDYLYKPWP